jgi:hypothetical protein
MQDEFRSHFLGKKVLLMGREIRYVHFTAKSNTNIDININFKDTEINDIYNIKFLGLTIDNTLSWKK